MITPERPVRSVNGIITGLHDLGASHLMLLAQVVAAIGRDRPGARAIGDKCRGSCHLARAYAEARQPLARVR